MQIDIHFSVTSQAKFGQCIFISGNLPCLGSWQIANALKLNTNNDLYPQWKSIRPLQIQSGTLLEFKMFNKNLDNQQINWENFLGNRTILLTASAIITFQKDSPQIHIQRLLQQQQQQQQQSQLILQPLKVVSSKRRGTVDIINDLSDYSESSSGNQRQFWNQRLSKSLHNVNAVGQFLNHAKITVNCWYRNQKPKHKSKSPKQLGTNIRNIVLRKIGNNFYKKTALSHITSHNQTQKEKMNIIDEYSSIKLIEFEDVSNIEQRVKNLRYNQYKGTLIFHISYQDADQTIARYLISTFFFVVLHIKQLLQERLALLILPHVIIIQNFCDLQRLLQMFRKQLYEINFLGDKKFLVRKNSKNLVIIYEGNLSDFDQIAKGKRNDLLSCISHVIMKEQFFEKAAFWRIQKKFSSFGDNRKSFTIAVNCTSLENLPQLIINDLISVSSKIGIQVFLFTQDKIQIIHNKIPISENNKLIVLNSHGDIFGHRINSSSLTDAFCNPMKDYQRFIQYILDSVSVWKQLRILQNLTDLSNNVILRLNHPHLISQSICEYISKQVSSYNQSGKLYAVYQRKVMTDHYILSIQPVIFTKQFYMQTILTMAQSVEYSPDVLYFDYTLNNESSLYGKTITHSHEKKISMQTFLLKQKEDWHHISFNCFSNILRKITARFLPDGSDIESHK